MGRWMVAAEEVGLECCTFQAVRIVPICLLLPCFCSCGAWWPPARHSGSPCTRHHQQDSLEHAMEPRWPFVTASRAQAHAGAGTSCMLQPTCIRHQRAPAAPFQPPNSDIARSLRSERANARSALDGAAGTPRECYPQIPPFWRRAHAGSHGWRLSLT